MNAPAPFTCPGIDRIGPLCPDRAAEALALFSTRMDYFRAIGDRPMLEGIRADMAELPPGTQAGQKQYLGLWKSGRLAAVTDLVWGYPDGRTLFIGLLLVGQAFAGQGLGRQIVAGIARQAMDRKLERMRLACMAENRSGRAFWHAVGFSVSEYRRQAYNGRDLLVMERRL